MYRCFLSSLIACCSLRKGRVGGDREKQHAVHVRSTAIPTLHLHASYHKRGGCTEYREHRGRERTDRLTEAEPRPRLEVRVGTLGT